MVTDDAASLQIEIAEAFTEDLPLLQHQVPGKSALQTFQSQMLKHLPVIMDRYSPFRIMINLIGLIHSGPGTVAHAILFYSSGV